MCSWREAELMTGSFPEGGLGTWMRNLSRIDCF